MAQFDVYENSNPKTCQRTPYLMDIQSDVLETLATRVVVPLRPYKQGDKAVITKLHPVIAIGNKEYVAIVSELAAIPLSYLGAPVFSASGFRQAIINACDLVLTGF